MTQFNTNFANDGIANPEQMATAADPLRFRPIPQPSRDDSDGIDIIDLDSGRHSVKPHTWGRNGR